MTDTRDERQPDRPSLAERLWNISGTLEAQAKLIPGWNALNREQLETIKDAAAALSAPPRAAPQLTARCFVCGNQRPAAGACPTCEEECALCHKPSREHRIGYSANGCRFMSDAAAPEGEREALLAEQWDVASAAYERLYEIIGSPDAPYRADLLEPLGDLYRALCALRGQP